MNTFYAITNWLDGHKEAAYDLLRIYLGIGLFVRGILLILNPSNSVEALMGTAEPTYAFVSAAMLHYVALAHLFGGALMAIGLLTRLAALVQLPILLGAVFLIHVQDGLLAAGQSLEFSALVLVLLVLVFLFGSGRWSVDYFIFRREAPLDIKDVPDALKAARQAHAERPQAAPARKEAAQPATCSCGHTRDHHLVTGQARYGMWGAMHLLFGITGPPKEVVYWCRECGEEIEKNRSPELLNYYRYH